jgi:hypothetical protein
MPYELGRNLFVVPVRGGAGPDRIRGWLRAAWRGLLRDGSVPQVFWSDPPRTEAEFIGFALDRGKDLGLIFTGQGPPDQLAGFFWLVPSGPGAAYIHHCFFKETWGRASALARPILERLLEQYHLLRGATPETNRAGLAFVRRMGFTILGAVPQAVFLSQENRRVGVVESYRLRPSDQPNQGAAPAGPRQEEHHG